VPSLGDSAILNHLLYASQSIVVGDGSLNALVLNAPLVCYGDLSVVGRLVSGTDRGGLFFLTPTLNWTFYASEGFSLHPVSQETLNAIWQSTFSGSLPQGYLIPIAGVIATETFFSPNYHALITPLLNQIKGVDGVLYATHDPRNPRSAINVALSPLTNTKLLLPTELLAEVTAIKGYEERVRTILPDFSINTAIYSDPILTTWAWVYQAIGSDVIKVEEDSQTLTVYIQKGATLEETVRKTTLTAQVLVAVQEVLRLLGDQRLLQVSVL